MKSVNVRKSPTGTYVKSIERNRGQTKIQILPGDLKKLASREPTSWREHSRASKGQTKSKRQTDQHKAQRHKKKLLDELSLASRRTD